jgi:hypothetical protein
MGVLSPLLVDDGPSGRPALARSLRTLSQTVGDAALAGRQLGTSVDNARASTAAARTLAQQSAGSMRALALVLQTGIAGVQPGGALAPSFEQTGQNLEDLAASLDSLHSALGQNRADAQRIAADLERLQTDVDAIASTLDPASAAFGPGVGWVLLQTAFFGTLGLLLAQCVAAGLLGLRLLRGQTACPLAAIPAARRAHPR